MKNKLSLLLLSLFAICFFTACEDDDDPFNGPYKLAILGSHEVVPETTEEFSIGNFTNPESYTWSVEGPAEIVGDNKGSTVSIKFNTVGEVVINVSNGVDAGRLTVEVAETEAAVTATLNGTGALRAGESDTVFFEFDAPVSEITDFMMNNEDSTAFNRGNTPFMSGTLGELVQIDDQNYYAIYTAGSGNGTPEAKFMEITSTAAYGAVTIDSAYVQLYKVDNIAPVADLSYSTEAASEGEEVTVTATFSEAVMSAIPGDSVLLISLAGAGSTEMDTLVATENPLVYTYVYEVGEGNGQIAIDLENVADLAGNALAGVNNATVLKVDNMMPVVTGSATDAGSKATVMISSSEAGTGMYLILKAGTTAPTDAGEFMAANGVVSRTVQLTAGNTKTLSEALATGSYNVYYMASDAAGNFSDIKTSSLVMN